MKIGIAGLGLIGGSIARAIKAYTPHTVAGFDLCEKTMDAALEAGAIDRRDGGEFNGCDIVIVALYPSATISYVKENADKFGGNMIITDCCGVKKRVSDEIIPLTQQKGFRFVGGHPMAGIEHSGFRHSHAHLFRGASMILCPPTPDIGEVQQLSELYLSLGFGKIKITTPEEHDRIIALTSQLAHVLSSAYVKSETALRFNGFSAGSFKDMTRVARLNEYMWAELFFENKANLISEIDGLVCRLNEYADALRADNLEKMLELLRGGRDRKLLLEETESVINKTDSAGD